MDTSNTIISHLPASERRSPRLLAARFCWIDISVVITIFTASCSRTWRIWGHVEDGKVQVFIAFLHSLVNQVFVTFPLVVYGSSIHEIQHDCWRKKLFWIRETCVALRNRVSVVRNQVNILHRYVEWRLRPSGKLEIYLFVLFAFLRKKAKK